MNNKTAFILFPRFLASRIGLRWACQFFFGPALVITGGCMAVYVLPILGVNTFGVVGILLAAYLLGTILGFIWRPSTVAAVGMAAGSIGLALALLNVYTPTPGFLTIDCLVSILTGAYLFTANRIAPDEIYRWGQAQQN